LLGVLSKTSAPKFGADPSHPKLPRLIRFFPKVQKSGDSAINSYSNNFCSLLLSEENIMNARVQVIVVGVVTILVSTITTGQSLRYGPAIAGGGGTNPFLVIDYKGVETPKKG
jgi:hypothetical protein